MLQQVYIGEVDLEEKETQDTLITMVEMLKKNKYIRFDLYAAISSNNPPVLPKGVLLWTFGSQRSKSLIKQRRMGPFSNNSAAFSRSKPDIFR